MCLIFIFLLEKYLAAFQYLWLKNLLLLMKDVELFIKLLGSEN